MRGLAQGLHIRRVTNWRLSVKPDGGAASVIYTKDDPGPVLTLKVGLDGLGNGVSLTLEFGELPFLIPYSVTLLLHLCDERGVWWDIAELIWENEDQGEGTWNIVTIPMQNKALRGYWEGWPAIPALNVRPAVLGGLTIPTPASGTAKVDEVLRALTDVEPDVIHGVDAARRWVIGRPQNGAPLFLSARDGFGFRSTRYEVTDYVTQVRGDPGEGWIKFDFRRSLGALVPENAQEVQVEFEEVTTRQGPPYGAQGVEVGLLFTLEGVPSEAN